MSILFSGDFHANSLNELSVITKRALITKYKQKKFDSINYHIILGDAGFLWPGNFKGDEYNFKVLAGRPFPILCVIGNHEPILGMSDIPEADIGIGESVMVVKKEHPFVAYLKRGRIYNIEDKKFLVLGGALSIDKDLRKPGISWWENEYWSENEVNTLSSLLERDNAFDYVLSHTGPGRVNRMIVKYQKMSFVPKFFDKVAALNDEIDKLIKCKQWFCGHWHKDEYYFDEELQRAYQYLYKKTALLEDGKITVV
jgi:hypothetical protein